MQLDEYQERGKKYDSSKNVEKGMVGDAMVEKTLGIAGEAGEVADKLKKIIWWKEKRISEEDKWEIVKELGDVMWYVAAVARYLEVPLSEVCERNLGKLQSRMDRDKLFGDGDNR